MKMMQVLALLIILLAAASACDAEIKGISIGQEYNCPDGVAPDQARVYAGEKFYVCGNVYLDNESLVAGTIHGNENQLMDTTTAITNGRFSLVGQANVKQHRYYYITPSLKTPCEKEFEPIPLEVKTKCVLIPPSTIQTVPNIVEQGKTFTIEVKNAPTDLAMEITGLKTPISTVITNGASWSRTLPSNECSALGSCEVSFNFTDSKHKMCQTSTNTLLTIKPPEDTAKETEKDNSLLILTFSILLLGTAGAVLLNRYL